MTDQSDDLFALASRIREAKQQVDAARDARRSAQDALLVAEQNVDRALTAYGLAQNALIVAAGGDDRSFLWQVATPNRTPTLER